MLINLAIIGAGKIARDQHIPAISGNPTFRLTAVVDPVPADVDVPTFASLADLLESDLPIDAVAICTPPRVRQSIALEAIGAELHVLLEKPPVGTTSEVAMIEAAVRTDRIVYSAWHSRHAPMIADARAWLLGRTIRSGRVVWREDARRWHPGQHWLWQPGGLGVFDPAINAFSILTTITDASWSIAQANLQIPEGLHAPIAAQLVMRAGSACVAVDLHFHDDTTAEWTIVLETDDGSTLELRDGGGLMAVNGTPFPIVVSSEYSGVYDRFAHLIESGQSQIDTRPLRLAADAFLVARYRTTAPFHP